MSVHASMIPVVKWLKNFNRLFCLITEGLVLMRNNEGDSGIVVYFVRNVFGVAMFFLVNSWCC